MKVVINGRFLTQATTGVQRFARETCRAMGQVLSESGITERVVVAVPSHTAQLDLDGVDGQCFDVRSLGRRSGHLWEQLELARFSPETVLINLCGTAPVFRRNQLVVLHDAAVAANPRNFSFAFRAWYRVMIHGYGRFARHFVTVSGFSRDEIARYWHLNPERIHVVRESGEHIKRATADIRVLERHGLERNKYILAVSSMAPNKNFGLVVRALDALRTTDLKLAVAGGAFSKIFAASAVEGANVTGLGYVSDGELRALYENAACFVYPSLYEGFGLPPVEAMNCGCPVIASRSSSMPEVCGNAVLYCDPESADSLAEQMQRVWRDSQLRDSLRLKGLERAAQFSWKSCAADILQICGAARGGDQ